MIIFWKSLFRPCLDPCSPLWSPIPSDFQEIDLLKETQRVFNRQIKGLEGLDYAEPLKKLKKPMYSIQRRNERFKIIYIYKIKEKLAPNISYRNGLTFSMHIRHGCRCNMPTFPMRGRAKKARDRSFAWTCGTHFPSVSEIYQVKMLIFSKGSWIKFKQFIRINPGALCLVTLLTDMVADQIPCMTNIETELLEKKII